MKEPTDRAAPDRAAREAAELLRAQPRGLTLEQECDAQTARVAAALRERDEEIERQAALIDELANALKKATFTPEAARGMLGADRTSPESDAALRHYELMTALYRASEGEG